MRIGNICVDEERDAFVIGDNKNALIIYKDRLAFLHNGNEYSFEDMLNKAANTKLVPLIEAEWYQTDDSDEWKCGACGHAECCDDYDPIDDLGLHYCSSCGARMIGQHPGQQYWNN